MFFTKAVAALLLLPSLAWGAEETVVDLAVATPELSVLTEALTFVGLVPLLANLTNLTVFAPTDAAFEVVPKKYFEPEWGYHAADILMYHVNDYKGPFLSSDLELDDFILMFNGGLTYIKSLDPPMINNATIVTADVTASNGVVHVIDEVLLPTSVTHNVVERLNFESRMVDFFADMLKFTNLTETLSGEGPFTIFAPTADAFDAYFQTLSNETVAFLTSPEGLSNLTDIIKYHIAPGIYHSDDLELGTTTSIEMLSGDKLFVTTPSLSELIGRNATKEEMEEFANATSHYLGHTMGGIFSPFPFSSPELTQSLFDEIEHYDIHYNGTSPFYVSLNNGSAYADEGIMYTNVLANNGIIHVIDAVLLPSQAEGLEEDDSVIDQIGDMVGDVVEGLVDAVTSKGNPDLDG